jgi:hypothetical protein
MPRRTVAAIVLWLVIVAVWAVFFHGGQVYMCLGPLNVTEESCRAANGMPPLTDWDRFMRGWGPPAIALITGWLGIAIVARQLRQRGGL